MSEQTMSEHESDAAAIIDFAKHYERAELHEVDFEGTKEQVLVTQDSEGGTDITKVRDLFADRAERPTRRKGTITVHDVATFIAATNLGSDDASVIFADVPGRKATAVLDFHEPSAVGLRGSPRWGQDRIEYGFTLSEPLRAWIAASKDQRGEPRKMTQAEFSAHIDNRLGDIGDPATAGDLAKDFAARRGVSFATVTDLLVFTRTIAARSSTVHKETLDENTGDATLEYAKKTDISTTDGKPVAVPAAFTLRIPILCGHEATQYTIAVRLRYDVTGGSVTWRIELNALDQYILAAIDEALNVVRNPRENPNAVIGNSGTVVATTPAAEPFVPGCGLPVLMGVAPPL